MKHLIFLITGLLAYGLFEPGAQPTFDPANPLDQQAFQAKLDAKETFAFLFKTDACPYCRAVMPTLLEYDRAQAEKGGKGKLPFFAVDASLFSKAELETAFDWIAPAFEPDDYAKGKGRLFVPTIGVAKDGLPVFAQTGVVPSEVPSLFEKMSILVGSQ